MYSKSRTHISVKSNDLLPLPTKSPLFINNKLAMDN